MTENETFKSRWGVIFAALGAAVGTGNIWRFPRETALNGGGIFILLVFLFLFLWSLPILLAEFSMGKYSREGTIGTYHLFTNGKHTWIGAWVPFVSTAIMFYYSVIMGWVIRYVVLTSTGQINANTDTLEVWNNFTTDPSQTIMYHFIAMLISGLIVYMGVVNGIEKFNTILIPTLFILLLFTAIWSLTLHGASLGLKYLFLPNTKYLFKSQTWLNALSQSAWSASAGMGMAITFGMYQKKKQDVANSAIIAGLGNYSVSLIAAIAVICTVYAVSPSPLDAKAVFNDPGGATAMIFIHITRLFYQMPFGNIIAPIFFLGMAFAALTSMIASFEVVGRNFMDFGWDRKKTVKFVGVFAFIMGIPSAISMDILDNQDYVWGLGILLSGIFISYVMWNFDAEKFRKEILNNKYNDIRIGKWWVYIIKYLIPVQFLFLLSWGVFQSIEQNPHTWFLPWEKMGLTTVFIQWAIAFYIFIRINRRLNERFIREKINKK